MAVPEVITGENPSDTLLEWGLALPVLGLLFAAIVVAEVAKSANGA